MSIDDILHVGKRTILASALALGTYANVRHFEKSEPVTEICDYLDDDYNEIIDDECLPGQCTTVTAYRTTPLGDSIAYQPENNQCEYDSELSPPAEQDNVVIDLSGSMQKQFNQVVDAHIEMPKCFYK